MRKIFLATCVFFIYTLISCDKEDQIDIHDFDAYKKNNPNLEEVYDNDTLVLVGRITSKNTLESLRIDIAPKGFSGSNYSYAETLSITGNNYDLNIMIKIQPNLNTSITAGKYNVILTATDSKGNTSVSDEDIHINQRDLD